MTLDRRGFRGRPRLVERILLTDLTRYFLPACCVTCCWYQEISVLPEQPRMIRFIFACYFSLFCLCRGTFGQVASGQQAAAASQAIDPEYRKFDGLVSFVRARNA